MGNLRKIWPVLLVCLLALTACGGDQSTAEQEENENVLIYAALNPVSKETQSYIDKFNKAHEDVQIVVHDYSDEGGIERLRVELLLGQVPDIMEMHYFGKNGPAVGAADRDYHHNPASGKKFNNIPGVYSGADGEYFMPYRQLALKGYLEDLWPYIENDPKLGREGVVEPILKTAEVNGGLYMLFQRVQVFSMIGRESVVGARYSWTMDDMMEIYAGMPEGSAIMRYNMTKREMFFNLLCNSLERYVDRVTGECFFDSKEFRDLTAFLEQFPDEVKYEDSDLAEEEIIRAIKDGRQMLEGISINWPREIAFADSIWQERASFVGYPTADGSSGSFFYATGHKLAMSAVCENKEAAWDFIRDLIRVRRKVEALEPFQDIPVNLFDYKRVMKGDLQQFEEHLRRDPERGLFNYDESEHFDTVRVHLMRHITEEDLQRHWELVEHTTRLYWPDDELSTIVWDTLGPYFAGDRTLDDTIRIINNRVGLYLMEQK